MDLRELIHNLNKIDEVKKRIDFHFNSLEEQIEYVADLLANEDWSEGQMKKNIENYFLTLPDKSRPKQSNNVCSNLRMTIQEAQDKVTETKKALNQMQIPCKISVVPLSSDLEEMKKRLTRFQEFDETKQIKAILQNKSKAKNIQNVFETFMGSIKQNEHRYIRF